MTRPARRICGSGVAALVVALAGALAPAAEAAPPAGAASAPIYSCVDANGRRLSSDRPIPECLSQEQRMLGRDGTVRRTVPPLLSPEQQAQREAQRKAQERAEAARNDAVRRDRLLLSRYPTLAAHDAARQRALEPVQKSIDTTRVRIARLETERLALINERAALGFKPVPEDLKLRTNGNDGSLEAQRTILRDQETERARVNQQFDVERQRLQLLLAGLPLGAQLDSATPAGPH